VCRARHEGKDDVSSNNEQDKSSRRGFAGLSDLVSKVAVPPPSSAVSAPPATRASAEPAPVPRQTTTPVPTRAATPAMEVYNPPATKPKSWLANNWGWVVGIGVVVLYALSNTQGGNQASNSQTSSATSSTATSSLTESMPPVGTDLILSETQIRYCLAEQIRVDAARTALDEYSQYSVDLFNSMIAIINSRCSSYRYHERDMSAARGIVEAHRNELWQQGLQRMSGGLGSSNPSGQFSQPQLPSNSGISSNNYSSPPQSGTSTARANSSNVQRRTSQGCEYKAVMDEDDLKACGISR
jgi:hypothetical protein